MQDILIKAGCYIAIIILGIVLRRSGFFKEEDFNLITKLVMKVTLPAALISSSAGMAISPSMLSIVLLGFGGMTTVVGMAIVFGVLVILMIVLYLLKVIFYKSQDKVKTEAVAEAAAADEDEEELVAVLTAAVAAGMKTSPNKVRINTYKRVHTDPPVWNRRGRREAIENKL